jgi:hypothetical protein
MTIGRWHFILRIITAAGLFVTAISVAIAYWGIREQHEWNRRQQTLVIINDSNKHLNEIRNSLRTSFPDMYSANQAQKLSPKDAEDLYNACPVKRPPAGATRFSCGARGVAADYLNYMDYIASSYVDNVADRRMIEKAFSGVIIEDYEYFENFVKHTEQIRKRQTWEYLQDAVVLMRQRKVADRPITGRF